MIKPAKVVQQTVVSSGSFGFSNWSQSERQRAVDEVNIFVEYNQCQSVVFLLMDQCMMDLWVVEREQRSWSQYIENFWR